MKQNNNQRQKFLQMASEVEGNSIEDFEQKLKKTSGVKPIPTASLKKKNRLKKSK